MKLTFRLKGGPGSGHRDHKGIPGHRGGSLPEGSSEGKASAGDKSQTKKPKMSDDEKVSKSSSYFLSKNSSAGQAIHDLALESETKVNMNFVIPKERMSDFKLMDEIMSELSEDERQQFMYEGDDESEGGKLRKKYGGDGKIVYDLTGDMFNGENGMKGIFEDQIGKGAYA